MIELIESRDVEGLMFFIGLRAAIILVCWFFMLMACIIDFWSGTTTSKALGQHLMSGGFRRTIIKAGDYIKLMLFALMFDALGSLFDFYVAPFSTLLCTAAVIIIEGKSVIENSKRRKTHAADIPNTINEIIKATTTEQGAQILNKLISQIQLNEKNERN